MILLPAVHYRHTSVSISLCSSDIDSINACNSVNIRRHSCSGNFHPVNYRVYTIVGSSLKQYNWKIMQKW